MMNRRQLMGAGIGAGAAALTVNMGQAQTRFRDLPEAASTDSPYTQVPPRPTTGLEYNPIVTLNGWSLPYRMNGNVKEFQGLCSFARGRTKGSDLRAFGRR